jgi:hypothetical protein
MELIFFQNKKKSDLIPSFFILLLLVSSGNPEGRQTKYISLFFLLIISLFYYRYITKEFFKKVFPVIAIIIILFVVQERVLWFTSWLGNFNLCVKIFFAALVIEINREKFIINYFNVIYVISFLSLILMFFDLVGIIKYLPHTYTVDNRFYYFVYQTRPDFLRNSGMFWEPGVFSNYLILAILFVLPCLKDINKFKFFIIVFTVVTTFSTSGYIILFTIFLFKTISFNISNIILGILISASFYLIYNATPFLSDKISEQSELALSAEGEMNYTRLGQLLFDLHYIEKHPFLGNGMHVKTRYSDHPVFQDEDFEVGHGNGFSQFIVSFGCVFVIFYFVSVAKSVSFLYKNNFGYSFFFIFIVILSLQNEPMMTYPFYWGFLFLSERIDD